MISKKLVNAVVKEAAKLRENATGGERGLLDLEQLNPRDDRYCIYGLMADGCRSGRAVELISKCAPMVIDTALPADDICSLRRGTKKAMRIWRAWSPIEVYIAQDGADNETLIDYLKGKLETLDLSHTVNC